MKYFVEGGLVWFYFPLTNMYTYNYMKVTNYDNYVKVNSCKMYYYNYDLVQVTRTLYRLTKTRKYVYYQH